MHQGSAYTYFVEVTLVLALSILSFTVEEYNATYNAKQFLWKLSNSHKKNNYWLFISHWLVVNKPLAAFISFCQFLLPVIPFNTRFSILLNWKVQEETTCTYRFFFIIITFKRCTLPNQYHVDHFCYYHRGHHSLSSNKTELYSYISNSKFFVLNWGRLKKEPWKKFDVKSKIRYVHFYPSVCKFFFLSKCDVCLLASMSQIWFFSYFICITGSFFNLFERPAIIILFVIQASVIHNMPLLFNMVCFLSNRLVFLYSSV